MSEVTFRPLGAADLYERLGYRHLHVDESGVRMLLDLESR